jgi:hypothetical protein
MPAIMHILRADNFTAQKRKIYKCEELYKEKTSGASYQKNKEAADGGLGR